MRLRILQIGLASIFGLVGLLGVIGSILHGGEMLGLAVFPLVLAAIAYGVFELQIRKLAEKGRRVRANIEDIARQVFDAPAMVRPGYDMTVTSGAFGTTMAGMETDVGFTADGVCKGVRTSIASHASTLGRQIGELSHVYSYVAVDLRGLEARFRLGKEGVGSALFKAAGVSKDTEVGDAGFDATWNVDCDPDLAREVFDDSIRARIMELQSKVGYVSQDFGVGTMSLVVTQHGLAIRWPGDIQPALAAFMRDLLLDMRTKILAHEDRKAAQGAASPGYRVVSDPIPESISEPDEEAKRRGMQS